MYKQMRFMQEDARSLSEIFNNADRQHRPHSIPIIFYCSLPTHISLAATAISHQSAGGAAVSSTSAFFSLVTFSLLPSVVYKITNKSTTLV